MKRLLFLMMIAIFGLFLIAANGDYDKLVGNYYYYVTFDTGSGVGAADSTTFDSLFRIPNWSAGYSTLHSRIIVGSPASSGDSSNGASKQITGVGDSIIVCLKTGPEYADVNTELVTIDSLISITVPCTLITVLDATLGDTLIRDRIFIWYYMTDTLNDSVPGTATTFLTAKYPIRYDITLK